MTDISSLPNRRSESFSGTITKFSNSSVSSYKNINGIPFEIKSQSPQFNFHLQNVAIVASNSKKVIDRTVKIHLPDQTFFEMKYSHFDYYAEFIQRIQEFLKERISNFHIVTKEGILKDGDKVEDFIKGKTGNVLLIAKGVRDHIVPPRKVYSFIGDKKLNIEHTPSSSFMYHTQQTFTEK